MPDLKIGDEILALSSDGQLVYSEVMLFLDRDPTSQRLFYQIQTESGSTLLLTPSHLIFVANDNKTAFSEEISQAIYAKNVQIGQFLYTSSISDNIINENNVDSNNNYIKKHYIPVLDRVVRVTTKTETGAYAPLTKHGNLIVNNIVASCYAVINDQTLAHWSFLPVRIYENLKDSFQYLAYLLHITNQESLKRSSSSTSPSPSTYPQGVHWYPKLLYSLSKYLLPADKMY